MNIKQAEELTGVTRQNIRFYEKQGLLAPARNSENDYREYAESDIETLKWIRAMRMLDMPLEEIRQVLNGSLELGTAAKHQQSRLEEEAKKLEGAIRLCETLAVSKEKMNVDECLSRMEASESLGYFEQWKLDYLAVCAAEHKRVFTFTPEEAVTTPAEFSAALFAFADRENLDLEITGESMYPIFTIDGIEYTACRDYHRVGLRGLSVPVATIHCEMTHPEDYLPPVPEKRRKRIGWLRVFLPGAVLFVYLLLTRGVSLIRGGEAPWKVAVLMASIGGMLAAASWLGWQYHFNEKT